MAASVLSRWDEVCGQDGAVVFSHTPSLRLTTQYDHTIVNKTTKTHFEHFVLAVPRTDTEVFQLVEQCNRRQQFIQQLIMASAVAKGIKRAAGFREPVIALISGSAREGSVNVKLARACG